MKHLNIHDLESKSVRHIWVVNKTAGENRSQIIFVIPTGQRQQELVQIPNTWIPVDLTEQVTKRQLMESTDFRRSLRNGLLDLISDEDAEEILATEDARAEMKRLRQAAKSHKRQSPQVNGNLPNMQPPAANSAPEEAPANMPSPAAQTIALQMAESTDMEIANTIRNLGSISDVDRSFLKDRSINFPKTQKVLEKLEAR